MINEQYELWCEKATIDLDLVAELKAIEGNEEAISDAFYKDLEFGTGGLRGIMGVGSNRMNIYTVGAATQGLSNYLNKKYRFVSVTTAATTAACLLKSRLTSSRLMVLRYICSTICAQLLKCRSLSATWVAKAVLSLLQATILRNITDTRCTMHVDVRLRMRLLMTFLPLPYREFSALPPST